MTSWPSPTWLAEADAALRAAHLTGGPLHVQHVITGDDGVHAYHLRVDRDGARVTEGIDDDATVVFRQSSDTAQAIRSGRLAAGEAVLLGRVTVSGDAAALVEHRAVLAAIDAVLATVA